jgi:hypothetical protein
MLIRFSLPLNRLGPNGSGELSRVRTATEMGPGSAVELRFWEGAPLAHTCDRC